MVEITKQFLDELIGRGLALDFKIDLDEFKFSKDIINGEEVYVLDKYTGDDTEVYLNDTFYSISVNAFYGSNIEVLDIGETKVLDSQAFSECYTLRKLIAPAVQKVGKYCCKDCINLEEVQFGSAIEFFEGAFSNCVKLKTVTGLERVKQIGLSCFSNCISLEELYFEDLTFVDKKAFIYCTNLKKLVMNNVEILSKRCCSYCTSLEHLEIKSCHTFGPCSLYADLSLKNLFVKSFSYGIFNTNLGLKGLDLNVEVENLDNIINIQKDLDENNLSNIKVRCLNGYKE